MNCFNGLKNKKIPKINTEQKYIKISLLPLVVKNEDIKQNTAISQMSLGCPLRQVLVVLTNQ